MAVYFLTNTTSDVGGINYMFSLQNIVSTRAISVTSLSTVSFSFITPTFYPNNNNFTTTNSTLVLNHTVINKNILVSATISRVNSAGVVQTVGTAATPQQALATVTFATLDDPAWSTTCSDRLLVTLTYATTSMATLSCTLGLDRNTTYLNSTIPINTHPSCPVLRKTSVVI
jgi:hypothetical protein